MGFAIAGIFALAAVFCTSAAPLYITRVFQGIGVSMAIPSRDSFDM